METTMQDTAVMRALMATDASLFLQNNDLGPRHPLQQPPRRGQADDATADDGKIIPGHRNIGRSVAARLAPRKLK